jgi:hypothetical protein
MNEVRPGDVIVSYVGGRIVSVSVAKAAACESRRHVNLGDGLWEEEGKNVEVEYRDLPTPLALPEIVGELQPLLPDRYSPLNRFGTGNQGYLFGLPPRVGRLLLERINGSQPDTDPDVLEAGVAHAARDVTERRALTLSRVGQGQFRGDVMGFWRGRCALTGLDLLEFLRASHIKPWRDWDNRERLDPYNGLLLSPAYDAAFDIGLISFDEDGRVMLSAVLTPARAAEVEVSQSVRINGLDKRQAAYLGYQRRHVFAT